MAGSGHIIRDEFTRFNTIYIGNIISGKVNCEIQLTLPAIAKLLGYDLERFFKDRDFNFEKTLEYRIWHHENIPDDHYVLTCGSKKETVEALYMAEKEEHNGKPWFMRVRGFRRPGDSK